MEQAQRERESESESERERERERERSFIDKQEVTEGRERGMGFEFALGGWCVRYGRIGG